MKEVGRTWQERGQRPSSETGTILSVDTHRSGVLSCRLLTTIAGQSSLGAQHARGRAGSPLDHMPSAPPPWRAYSRKAWRQKERGGGLTVSTILLANSNQWY